MLLDFEAITEISTAAVDLGLHMKREQLLAGISNRYIAQLPVVGEPGGQLFVDLGKMNETPMIVGGVVPLYRWLSNAAFTVAYLPEKQNWFRELASKVLANARAETDAAAPGGRPPGPAPGEPPPEFSVPEKIVHTNDMVSFGYLKGAERTGLSTARLTVSALEGGAPRLFPNSTKQKRYNGTGWLIGSRFLITNHHVVNARDPGDADATEADFAMQARKMRVQFDFDAPDTDGLDVEVKGLRAANKPLDFAIVELAEAIQRSPLPLLGQEIVLSSDPLPVNIVQHPGGQPKKLAIRNNLAAKATDVDIGYYTDTEGGSSGSAVCNDEWQVIALHKASTEALGTFNFQGKSTAWVNIGTRITKIIDELKSNHAALWGEIKATVL